MWTNRLDVGKICWPLRDAESANPATLTPASARTWGASVFVKPAVAERYELPQLTFSIWPAAKISSDRDKDLPAASPEARRQLSSDALECAFLHIGLEVSHVHIVGIGAVAPVLSRGQVTEIGARDRKGGPYPPPSPLVSCRPMGHPLRCHRCQRDWRQELVGVFRRFESCL